MSIPSLDLLTLTPDAIISLFVLDLNPAGTDLTYRFTNWTQTEGDNIVWQGETYLALPFEISGFESSTRGQAQPSITLSNVFGVITAFTLSNDDLVGANLIRKRTLAKYLDGMPSANPSIEFVDDNFTIWRKSGENALTITFELRRFSDLGFKSQIPNRNIRKYSCAWEYRSEECGYSGGAVADINDVPTSDMTKDKCGKRLASCRLRFGTYNQLPFGGFPGVDIS